MRRLILFAALALALAPARGDSAPPIDLEAPVRVTNDASEAIPVTLQPGANIGVTGDVNVGGTVSVEQGADPLVVVGPGEPIDDRVRRPEGPSANLQDQHLGSPVRRAVTRMAQP
jgi:hypothetical protein